MTNEISSKNFDQFLTHQYLVDLDFNSQVCVFIDTAKDQSTLDGQIIFSENNAQFSDFVMCQQIPTTSSWISDLGRWTHVIQPNQLPSQSLAPMGGLVPLVLATPPGEAATGIGVILGAGALVGFEIGQAIGNVYQKLSEPSPISDKVYQEVLGEEGPQNVLDPEFEQFYEDALKQGLHVLDPEEYAKNVLVSKRIADILEQLRRAEEGGYELPGLQQELADLMSRNLQISQGSHPVSGLTVPSGARAMTSMDEMEQLIKADPGVSLYVDSSQGLFRCQYMKHNDSGEVVLFGTNAVSDNECGQLNKIVINEANIHQVYFEPQSLIQSTSRSLKKENMMALAAPNQSNLYFVSRTPPVVITYEGGKYRLHNSSQQEVKVLRDSRVGYVVKEHPILLKDGDHIIIGNEDIFVPIPTQQAIEEYYSPKPAEVLNVTASTPPQKPWWKFW